MRTWTRTWTRTLRTRTWTWTLTIWTRTRTLRTRTWTWTRTHWTRLQHCYLIHTLSQKTFSGGDSLFLLGWWFVCFLLFFFGLLSVWLSVSVQMTDCIDQYPNDHVSSGTLNPTQLTANGFCHVCCCHCIMQTAHRVFCVRQYVTWKSYKIMSQCH